jgi:hypothetical protein
MKSNEINRAALVRLNHLVNGMNTVDVRKHDVQVFNSVAIDHNPQPEPVLEPDPAKITVIKLENSQRTNNVQYFDTTVDAVDYLLSGESTDRYEVIYGDECGINNIDMEYRTPIPTGGSDVGFQGKDVVEKLYIGTPVKAIGRASNTSSFQEGVITTLTFAPDSVQAINPYTFSRCYALTSITFPETSLQYIGNAAFFDCTTLTSIHIPASVVAMGEDAFYDGPRGGITTLTFESGGHLMAIPYRAFGNRNFNSLTIPGFVKSIGNSAFYSDYASSNPDLTAGAISITIEDGVLQIGDSAFRHHSKLQSLDLGNTVTTIGANAFAYSPKLFTLEIPASVTTLGTDAFASLGVGRDQETTIQVTVHKTEGSLDLAAAGIYEEYINITWNE